MSLEKTEKELNQLLKFLSHETVFAEKSALKNQRGTTLLMVAIPSWKKLEANVM